jgi:hypothetical protein
MKRIATISSVLLVVLGFVVLPALAFTPPKITLERIDVASIQPFFIKPRIEYKDEKDPGKEMGHGYTATMSLAYVLKIHNPNKEPVMLDELTFTANFDGFEVNMVNVDDDSWIPGGKSNFVRLVTVNEAMPTIANLMVSAPNVEKMTEMKTNAGALVSKWWKDVPDFSFPITITNGSAVFKDEKGKEVRVTFKGDWGEKTAAPAEKTEPEKKEPEKK